MANEAPQRALAREATPHDARISKFPREALLPGIGTIEVTTAVCVSTAHVTQAEAQILDAGGTPDFPLVAMKGEHGWLLYVGNGEDLATWRLSRGFRAVVEVALTLGIEFIRFDGAGPVLAGVPTHDW